MSQSNKSSKSDKPVKRNASEAATSKSPARDSQKLELVKIIAPSPPAESTATVPPAESLPQEATPQSAGRAAKKAKETAAAPPVSEDSSAPTPTPEESAAETGEAPTVKAQPIPPVTELMQFRAIGMVFGRYIPEEEHFNKGKILSSDGTEIDAVLLGKIISIVKKRLAPEKEHNWIVYPRTRKTGELHVQIAGVWAPLEMGKPDQPVDPGVSDGYFSIRAEVVSILPEENCVEVRIRRSIPKQDKSKGRRPPQGSTASKAKKAVPNKFKLRLRGFLPPEAVNHFCDIEVQREGMSLDIVDARVIAPVPPRRGKPFKKGGRKGGGKYPPRGDRPARTGGESGKFSPSPRPRGEKPQKPIRKPPSAPS